MPHGRAGVPRVCHYHDVIMGAMASQITSITIVYSTVYSVADQRKPQNSTSLAFVWGIHRRPVNSPHKWPVTRKMFPFDDVIMSVGRVSQVWFYQWEKSLQSNTVSHWLGANLNSALCPILHNNLTWTSASILGVPLSSVALTMLTALAYTTRSASSRLPDNVGGRQPSGGSQVLTDDIKQASSTPNVTRLSILEIGG